MRRLTLILSDLYLPEEAADPHSEFVALPELEWLLRFAQRRARIADWRAALAAEVGCATLAPVAPARFAAQGRVAADRMRSCWFATPVQLEARLDHVRLDSRGLLRIPADERLAWCAEFARSFGPELTLHDAGARGFFLSGLLADRVTTVDPARILGADIATSLARGEDALTLRRLSAELEMWLHSAALNRERERGRLPRISSLWIWGGEGTAEAAPVARNPSHGYAGLDPYLAALSRAQTGADPLPVPDELPGLDVTAPHAIVELAPMSESAGALPALEAQWFGPARAALAQGALEQLDVLANDLHFVTRRHGGWRFWRRRRHWLELLRRPRDAAKA